MIRYEKSPTRFSAGYRCVLFSMPVIIALAVIFLPFVAKAEESAHEGGIPMSVVWQFVNFALYVGVLVYYTRHPIKNFFAKRQEAYRAALIRGEQAKKDAENKRREIQERLGHLEKTSANAVNEAKAEAAQLVRQIQEQGDELAKRLREDSDRVAAMEIERARLELRAEIIDQSLAQSRRLLEDKDKVKETDQKRMQTEFVSKIQEVPG